MAHRAARLAQRSKPAASPKPAAPMPATVVMIAGKLADAMIPRTVSASPVKFQPGSAMSRCLRRPKAYGKVNRALVAGPHQPRSQSVALRLQPS
jgi:hypothetical protein